MTDRQFRRRFLRDLAILLALAAALFYVVVTRAAERQKPVAIAKAAIITPPVVTPGDTTLVRYHCGYSWGVLGTVHAVCRIHAVIDSVRCDSVYVHRVQP